jgi:N-acylneuraminate cytidylyltransferase
LPKTIAIIPARGGSKRLPRKNLLSLDGLPLIVHSINYAKENLELLDDIFVSTEDEEIKSVAREHGVEVIDRPIHLASDTTPTVDVLKDALLQIGSAVDNVVILQVTNPLRPANLLRDAFSVYSDNSADSLMAITRNHQKFGRIEQEKFVPYNYKIGQRSQDLEPLYFENGLLYISKAECIAAGEIMGKNNIPFIVEHPFAQVDIDTSGDLKYAEFILNTYKE